LHHGIFYAADAFHGAFDPVASLEIDRRGARGADPGGRARGQDIRGKKNLSDLVANP